MTEPADDTRASKDLLASNMVYATISVVLLNVSVFVGNWAVIRWYGAAFHGHLAWLVSASGLAMLLSNLGLASAGGIRTIARLRAAGSEKLTEAVSALVTIPLAVSAVLAAAMIALAEPIAAARPGLQAGAVRLAGTWILLMAAVRACQILATGFERLADVLLMTPTAQACKTAWVFLCAALTLAPIWIFVGWTGAWGLGLALSAYRTRRLGREEGFRIRLRLARPGEWLRTVAEALPYYLPQISMMGMPFLLQLIIGIWQPSTEVSIFQVCFSLALVSRLLAAPIATALLPRVAHIDASPDADRDQIAAVLGQTTRLLGLAATLTFALYWAFGHELLGRLYGPTYAVAVPTLLLLALTVGVMNYCLQLDQVLMAMQYVRVVAWLELVKYAVLAGVVWWAVPAYSTFGAAAAIAGASIADATAKILIARPKLRGIGVGAFACTVGTFAAVVLAGRLPYGRYLSLPVWIAAAAALRLLRPKELLHWSRIVVRALQRRGVGPGR
jgi:O-antigen/teichoic acid export membrane protein